MKRTKISLLLVFVLLFSILLTSCSNRKVEKTLDTLFDDEYESTDQLFSKMQKVKGVDGYIDGFSFHGYESVAFLSNTTNEHTKYKVYSLITKSVILELTDENVEYKITNHVNANHFVVQYTSKSDNGTDIKFIAYDLTGALIAESSNSNLKDYQSFGDHIILNNSVYKLDSEKGTLEEVIEIESFSIPSGEIIHYNDKFVYFANKSSGYDYISVHNTELEQIYYYQPPSYLENFQIRVLNDGKIFAQARIKVTSDAEDYDYYLADEKTNTIYKYKKCQLLIDPENSTVKEIDIGYMLSNLSSNYTLNKNESIYGDEFENIAYVYPIVDKKLNTTDKKMVFMDNNAKITGEIKLLENQESNFVQRIALDRYLVPMLNSTHTLIDGKGNIIASNMVSVSCAGEYIVSNNAIYDLDMNLIYDTRDVPIGTNSTIIGTSKTTVFVNETTGFHELFYVFKDGEKQLLVEQTKERSTDFDAFELFNFGYTIRDLKNHTQVFYNFNGEKIGDFRFTATNYYAYSDDSHLIQIGEEFYLVT